jgi:hypothetical protein
MNDLYKALPWVAFWAAMALFVWISHKQFMAGYDNSVWVHRTPAELRLQEAAVRRAELQAGIEHQP